MYVTDFFSYSCKLSGTIKELGYINSHMLTESIVVWLGQNRAMCGSILKTSEIAPGWCGPSAPCTAMAATEAVS